MRIKAKTNGNVIEARDDTAKHLIDAGYYDAVDEPVTGSDRAPDATAPVPAKGRKPR